MKSLGFKKISVGIAQLRRMSREERQSALYTLLLNNALYIVMAATAVFIAVRVPAFLSLQSVINIISLAAAKLPLALGLGGCMVLSGIDVSAGRAAGLAACVSAVLLQASHYENKLFPWLETAPVWVALLAAVAAGAAVGFINGFFVAKIKLNSFAATFAARLVLFGAAQMFLMLGNNNGQPLSGLDSSYTEFVCGRLFEIGGVAVPKYVLYSAALAAIIWIVWNKTKFGKRMFAVGSNEKAARICGINVFATAVGVFVLSGAMYGITGLIEGARIGSCSANTGLSCESDAFAACVIGGMSFVGGTGTVGGIVAGMLMLQLLFASLNFLSVSANMLYVIKGAIILAACVIDMRKHINKRQCAVCTKKEPSDWE